MSRLCGGGLAPSVALPRSGRRLLRLAVLGKNLRAAPDFVVGVIKRRWRGANDVWFAEVALNPCGFKFLEEFLRTIVYEY